MKRVRFENHGQVSYLGQEAEPVGIAQRINGAWHVDAPIISNVANSNTPVPADPDTGIHGCTRVKTPDGAKEVSELGIGDTVLDHLGQKSRITTISPSAHASSAIVLRAPFFGLDQDLVCGRNQLILLASEVVEALLDQEAVLMPVWALKDGQRAVFRELSSRDQLFEIKLDSGNAPQVGDCIIAPKPRLGVQPIAYQVSEAEARSLSAGYRAGYFAN